MACKWLLQIRDYVAVVRFMFRESIHRLVRYLMRSKEITLGRATPSHQVDVDFSLEGPAWKVAKFYLIRFSYKHPLGYKNK